MAALIFVGSPALAELSLKKVAVALKPDKNPDQMLQEQRGLSDFLLKKNRQTG